MGLRYPEAVIAPLLEGVREMEELALCYCGHDPDWEHQEWLDTATIESPPPLAGKLQDTPISRCSQTRCQGEEE